MKEDCVGDCGRLRRDRTSEPLEGLDRLIDLNAGRLSRRVYWDSRIYEQELEKIFARSWLFLAHESQIPKAGDYISAYMAEDNVIVVRQKDGSIKAFLNTCPHRGNKINFADAGNARSFICNYHGWSFGIDGGLRGMAGQELFENSGLKKEDHGLHPVTQVATYKGLVFGNMDAEAPSLSAYLGDFRYYLDVMLDMDGAGTEFVGGCVKSVINCNWKVPVENFIGDIYHALWTHDSAARAMLGGPVAEVYKNPDSYHVNCNGHGWEFNLDIVGNAATLGDKEIRKYLYRIQPEVARRLGDVRSKMIGSISSAGVFPNLSFLPGQNTFRVWHPRGPGKIELHTWTLVNKSAPPEIKERWRKGAMLTFSPSGVFEMDDGENFEFSTRTNAGFMTRQQDLYMGLGRGTRLEESVLPGNVYRNQVNEANHRAFYRRWLDLMQARSWNDVPLRDPAQLPESAFVHESAAQEVV
ncbi:3-phenylpropionate/cinnamic acid dioxygenase subunit alpha [Achromobacter insolitus]|uniref:aromatic ring-hydroxylating dioxygenase subunit alpha n=1 Tax=Achromobacter insolitus TaxID=217204 RepID=UPI000972C399|nr:aromatic ring-hydroxylating dioxygenase subunit alpha [Achromobacter insolitus]APX75609.1 aromatic ring-hydroxylating dioxygenase subunit alpha [Achromobacter insolitus]OWT59781.1 aromatic ring-hydroxylating dioxygenase subunit alpha [Achromobacter insolitus]CAB3704339.1 3-phenylpropionate/cinnamic acid dioxygenase subunit alpha [Achromobacter insolitus]VEG67160.1 3-phenylpropionate/cinnamic acid dioxygenase subunit alpha [Achromobacter insolitus]